MKIAHGKLYVRDKEGNIYQFLPTSISSGSSSSDLGEGVSDIECSIEKNIFKLKLIYSDGRIKNKQIVLSAIKPQVINDLS